MSTDGRGLIIHNLYKSFDSQIALAGVSFTVEKKEIVALLGPSGCGKSTVLAIIAGIERQDNGNIFWDGDSIFNIPTHKRGFGLMFQDFALFPHMNVFQNVAFGLRMGGQTDQAIQQRVHEVLALVNLHGYDERDVNTLSGGEAQRVALARSLAPNPRLLMLDEPLGSLDRNLRERLMTDLRQILRANQLTSIYVTHDQEEAFSVADRIVLMNSGCVVQIGSPQDIYRNPKNSFAARFLGLDNLIPGQIQSKNGANQVVTHIGTFPLDKGSVFSREVIVLLRPDSVHLGGEKTHQLIGQVMQIAFRGSISRLVVKIGGQAFSLDLQASSVIPREGDQIVMSFNPVEAIQVFSE